MLRDLPIDWLDLLLPGEKICPLPSNTPAFGAWMSTSKAGSPQRAIDSSSAISQIQKKIFQ
jgi:hypothetical protein